MTRNCNRETITGKTETAFLLIFGAYVFISLVESSLLYNETVLKIVKIASAISLMSLLYLQFCSRNQYRRIVIIAALILLSFSLAFFATDRFYIILYAMMIILAGDVRFNYIVKTSLVSMIAAVIVILAALALGIIEDYVYISGSRVAHCLGFIYYSFLPFIVFYCVLMYLYLRGRRTSIAEYCVFFALSYYIYKLSTLRLTFALSLFTMALHFTLVKLDILRIQSRIVATLAGAAFPIGALATFLGMIMYDARSPFWIRIDDILNGRVALMSEGLQLYPINLFGNNIEMRGNNIYAEANNYFYIDSGFAYALLAYGLIFTIIVIVLYSSIFKYSCIINNKELFVWVASVLLFTMINNTWVSIDHNPVLLCAIPAVKYLNARSRVAVAESPA